MKTFTYAVVVLFVTCFSLSSKAATHLYRLTWDSDPSHEAVIGFSPKTVSLSPYVMFGMSTDESSWKRADVSATASFFSLSSSFVRLTSLPADSAIYFTVCDQDGCGQRMWFKTAADYQKPFTAIAGGDTRTGWTTRRDGNVLVAKIRPLFVMHGGDFTNGNTPIEMLGFLDDWQLTMSEDIINDKSYKRIYPLIPTHGNHEDTNYATLCQVFGVDYVRDDVCDEQDAYGAMTINGLARIYTLNSQFQESGWQVFADQMNTWLEDDLNTHANENIWRIAQYHKPIFPHFDGKPKNEGLFNWWASLFYANNMNLVVESDTHINKLTYPLQPATDNIDFVRNDEGGTVYVGEGSWGAPARSANQSFPWTVDLASVQQFKVLSVTENRLDVRTAEFEETANALTGDERNADPLALPDKVTWWHANGIGDVYSLIQNTHGKTALVDNNTQGTRSFTLTANHDSYIASARPTMNYNGSQKGMVVVNNSQEFGDTYALMRFDATAIARCAELKSAALSFQVNPAETRPVTSLVSELVPNFPQNPSSLGIVLAQPSFLESRVNWNNGNALLSAQVLNTVEAVDAGNNVTMPLDSNTIKNLQAQFLKHNAFGFGITSLHPTIERFIDASENTKAPTLHTTFAASKSCFNTPNNQLAANQVMNDLSGRKYSFIKYQLAESAVDRQISISTSGGFGNANLYVAVGEDVTLNQYNCRPYTKGNDEKCVVDVPASKKVHIGIHGRERYSSMMLTIAAQ